jgi:hypothetical protein
MYKLSLGIANSKHTTIAVFEFLQITTLGLQIQTGKHVGTPVFVHLQYHFQTTTCGIANSNTNTSS